MLLGSKYRRILLPVAVHLLLMLSLVNCTPRGSGLTLTVSGKEFSNADIIVDGVSVRRRRQSIGNGQNDSGSLPEYISISPGRHRIVLEAVTGRRLEIEAEVPPGENYVHYSSDEMRLHWNDDSYEAVPGKTVQVLASQGG